VRQLRSMLSRLIGATARPNPTGVTSRSEPSGSECRRDPRREELRGISVIYPDAGVHDPTRRVRRDDRVRGKCCGRAWQKRYSGHENPEVQEKPGITRIRLIAAPQGSPFNHSSGRGLEMGGRIGGRLLILFVVLAGTRVNAGCVDPEQLADSTVSIMRHFDEAERDVRPDLVGIRGTGWFLSPTVIVTAEHVTAAMKLSPEDWKPLEIVSGDGSQFIPARIQRLSGNQAEKLAVIELQLAVSGARSPAIRNEALLPEEQVMTLGYTDGRPHFVAGRFVRYGDNGKLAGTALLEFYEGDNRFIIDHGASGAPVMDCTGRVAAVVSDVFTQTLMWGSHPIRISTAWGMPNVVSLPVQALNASPRAD